MKTLAAGGQGETARDALEGLAFALKDEDVDEAGGKVAVFVWRERYRKLGSPHEICDGFEAEVRLKRPEPWPNEIDERVKHVLARPEMWAASAEALEATVLTLLWARDGSEHHRDLVKFLVKNGGSDGTNRPLWAQRDVSVPEMATLLSAFFAEYILSATGKSLFEK